MPITVCQIRPVSNIFARGLLLATMLATSSVAMAVEEAKYSLLLKESDFELRAYAPQVLAETRVTGSLEDAGDQAFRKLFRYISGHNTASQKIAMTSPVSQQSGGQKIAMTAPVSQEQRDGQWAVSFMMPANFTPESTPQPTNPEVYLRSVPSRTIAAVRYSGFWSEEGYAEHKQKLSAWIEEQGWQQSGEAVWARYNPPFMPWFLRRNEVLIPVTQ